MRTILADGQCHYAFHVETQAGKGMTVHDALTCWKEEVRLHKGFQSATIAEVCDKIRRVPGVLRVVPTGPRSALPLALRMACGLTGKKGVFACHNGRGILSDAIRNDLRGWNIDFLALRDLQGDMPASFLIYDPNHTSHHDTATVYPLSRTSYRHRSDYPSDVLCSIDGLLLNRVNGGILASAKLCKQQGKPVSLRIHGYSRYVVFDDYRPLLPWVDHLLIDSGHDALRGTAQALGLAPPRDWLGTAESTPGVLGAMAEALDAIAGKRLLHAYSFSSTGTLHLLGSAGQTACSFQPVVPPGELCDLKTTSRIHGALLAGALLNKPEFVMDSATCQPRTEDGLAQMAKWVLLAAHHGILNVPWQWPDTRFDISAMTTKFTP